MLRAGFEMLACNLRKLLQMVLQRLLPKRIADLAEQIAPVARSHLAYPIAQIQSADRTRKWESHQRLSSSSSVTHPYRLKRRCRCQIVATAAGTEGEGAGGQKCLGDELSWRIIDVCYRDRLQV
jgi:hypothetical protein